MDCPSDAGSWYLASPDVYWLAIVSLGLLNWWLFGKWKDAEQFLDPKGRDATSWLPDFYDSERSSRGPSYVGEEDEVSKHRKRQKKKEKLEKAREERAKRISAAPSLVTVQRSADGQITTTVSPPKEVSWEQDDSIGLVPVDENDDEAPEVI